ncbi:MAG: hypothetical protein KDD69_06890 [Bdellovibrionales bacterium]|nr:hypothetical protein [Bdellovibrionales bacterium]
MANVLGLQFGHDGAAAIIRDNRLVCAISNERLSRQKKASGVTEAMLQYVLDEAGLTLADIECVAICSYFYSPENVVKVFDLQQRELTRHLIDLPTGATHTPCIVGIGDRRLRGVVVQHHIAHCASAYYMSPFEAAACLSVDASMFRPEACSLFAYGSGHELHYHSCPGIMIGNAYSVFTEKLGIGPGLTKAGTTMALASFGKASKLARAEWRRFALPYWERRSQPSDPVHIDLMWAELSGLAPHQPFPREESDSPKAMVIAASLQFIFEEALVEAANALFEQTRTYNGASLCLSGGSFLNCNTNMAIKRRTPFQNVFLFPGCGDDGTAVGAALFATHNLLQQSRERYTPGDVAYLGRSYPDPQDGEAYDPREVARAIAQGKIVAVCRGRSEFGPRALGNRSLLADPRNPAMKDIINERVKHREWYRPFAPVVLAEKASEWFDADFPSPFMLFIAEAKRPELVPAVLHVDRTARLQTVSHEDNPALYELVQAFDEETGVPMLLNTSLNDNGEPLVETPEDAKRFFARGNVDLLVLGNRVFHNKL